MKIKIKSEKVKLSQDFKPILKKYVDKMNERNKFFDISRIALKPTSVIKYDKKHLVTRWNIEVDYSTDTLNEIIIKDLCVQGWYDEIVIKKGEFKDSELIIKSIFKLMKFIGNKNLESIGGEDG